MKVRTSISERAEISRPLPRTTQEQSKYKQMRRPVATIFLPLALAASSCAMGGNIEHELAASSLEIAKNQEKKILSLPGELRDVAIMHAAGLLNIKTAEFAKEKLAKAEMTQRQLFHMMSISLLQLANLTQQANWNDATVCHISEASVSKDAAKGAPYEPVNCRSAVYGPKQVQVVRLAPRLKETAADESVNTWATRIILYSLRMAEAEPNF